MAGIYIHIPFCKKACHYCNFHFSTSMRYKEDMLSAIHRELELRYDYLDQKNINSIYFGGGTPSVLSGEEIAELIDHLSDYYQWDSSLECTLEANPDDLTIEKITAFRNAGINRLSIGVQSFFDTDLELMNRSHDAIQARTCILSAQDQGLENISIDLIFGLINASHENWQKNLEIAQSLGIPHLSCYGLTIEEGTTYAHWIKNKKINTPSEKTNQEQFKFTQKYLQSKGYEQYEISNYALIGQKAVHNSNYWKNEPYLGLGPSAHSYNGHSRQWNLANNQLYIKNVKEGSVPFEIEYLDNETKYNEYVLTRLRTIWGCQAVDISNLGKQFLDHFTTLVTPHLQNGNVLYQNDTYRLSNKGKLIADKIALDLFWSE